jgi:hypothetical protein
MYAHPSLHSYLLPKDFANTDRLRQYRSWLKTPQSQALKSEYEALTNHPPTDQEAFLFHLLESELYPQNPNSPHLYNDLLETIAPSFPEKEATAAVKAGKLAYRQQRDNNVRDGILYPAEGALEQLHQLSTLPGVRMAIASKGLRSKQDWKIKNVLFRKNPKKLRIPLYTTQKGFAFWKWDGPKDKAFYQRLKEKLGAKPGDLMVMVGDRHDSDILPARTANYWTVHVPGRRDQGYLTGEKQSQADIVSDNLADALTKLGTHIRNWTSKASHAP